MERRFKVYDGDGEVIRTFVSKAEALTFMEQRPEFTLMVTPKPPKEKPIETEFERLVRENGDALL